MSKALTQYSKEIHLWAEQGLNIKPYIKQGFNLKQLSYIRYAIEEGIDLNLILSTDCDSDIMENCMYLYKLLQKYVESTATAFDIRKLMELYRAFQTGSLNAALLINHNYTLEQLKQLRKGLESFVDIRYFANPIYTAEQMKYIRKGLEDDLNINAYLNYKLSANQMREIYQDLKFLYN